MAGLAALRRLRESLRARLLLIALAGTLAAALAGAYVMYLEARAQTEALHDRQLADVAHTIIRFAQHELLEIQADPGLAGALTAYDDGDFTVDARYRFQIWSPDGRLLLRSRNAPADRMLATRGQIGYGHGVIDGEAFVTYADTARATRMQVQIAAPRAERDVALGRFGADTLLVFAGTFVPLAAFLAVALWLAVRPVAEAARQVAERGPGDLQPLDESSLPVELRPMTAAINGLMQRIDQALQRERDFNAVAAHEMRTPLAALRMQAQVALRARDDGQRRDALGLLAAGVDRCAHLIDQLLALARVDAATDPAAFAEPIDLGAVVDEVLQDLGDDARRRSIVVRTQLDPVMLHGQRFGVRTLVANLLGNAIRYTPEGGTVSIQARQLPQGVTLTVDDSGSGIAPRDRERVFERFRRLRSDGSGGAGLGLSIAQTVARAHKGLIELGDSPLGGLRVQVHLPAATA